MSDLYLVLFVVAFGFVTAAIITNIIGALFQKDGQVTLSFASTKAAALSLLFFMVSGPYLVFSNGMSLWRQGVLPTGFVGFCLVATLVWSFCLGVLVIQAFTSIGIAH